jgi:hypothetical protein
MKKEKEEPHCNKEAIEDPKHAHRTVQLQHL